MFFVVDFFVKYQGNNEQAYKNFTRDLNSELLGRRFEFDFIEIQFYPPAGIMKSQIVLPPLFSRCMKAEKNKRVQYGVERCEMFTLL